MALNQRYSRFEHISMTATRDTNSGDPVRVGQVAGVAQTSANTGDPVTLWLNGSYTLDVDGALTEGQAVFIDSEGQLSTDGVSGEFFGVAVLAKATGEGAAEVAPAGIITPTTAAETGE